MTDTDELDLIEMIPGSQLVPLHKNPNWKEVVFPFDPANLTPQGYDFRLAGVQTYTGMGRITHEGTKVPGYRSIEAIQGAYFLTPGQYLVTFRERVTIPSDYFGLMWSRSSLLRCGAALQTAIWDSGYEGVGKSCLVVYNSIIIEENVRIGHMVLVPNSQRAGLYRGQYQSES